jgi:hypothetical protein
VKHYKIDGKNPPVCYNLDMKKDELHVKQDEWLYTCTKSSARIKAKRARTKAKRSLSKKLLAQEMADE